MKDAREINIENWAQFNPMFKCGKLFKDLIGHHFPSREGFVLHSLILTRSGRISQRNQFLMFVPSTGYLKWKDVTKNHSLPASFPPPKEWFIFDYMAVCFAKISHFRLIISLEMMTIRVTATHSDSLVVSVWTFRCSDHITLLLWLLPLAIRTKPAASFTIHHCLPSANAE